MGPLCCAVKGVHSCGWFINLQVEDLLVIYPQLWEGYPAQREGAIAAGASYDRFVHAVGLLAVREACALVRLSQEVSLPLARYNR